MQSIQKLIKLGAYLILFIGIIVSVFLFCFAIYFGFIYPSTNLTGKVIVALIAIIIAVALFIVTLSIFETILETVKLEEKFDQPKKQAKEVIKN